MLNEHLLSSTRSFITYVFRLALILVIWPKKINQQQPLLLLVFSTFPFHFPLFVKLCFVFFLFSPRCLQNTALISFSYHTIIVVLMIITPDFWHQEEGRI